MLCDFSPFPRHVAAFCSGTNNEGTQKMYEFRTGSQNSLMFHMYKRKVTMKIKSRTKKVKNIPSTFAQCGTVGFNEGATFAGASEEAG
jgi:hypothetical protein